jgi:enoyl-CoA hydratase/carnithine racemase
MSEHVVITRRDSSVEILLDRPAKKNALSSTMYGALAAAMREAAADPSVTSVLLHGAGSAFTAGNDLQDFVTNPPTEGSPVLQFLDALATNPVPLVTAVHGPTVGIGATLLLHCDYVAAAESTQLIFPFVNLALIPEAASSLLLPRAVGYLRASEILLTGDPVDARRALDLGLVSRVTDEGEQLAAARAFADRLDGKAPEAVRVTKQLLKDDTAGVHERLAAELRLFTERLGSPEFIEAASAFLQKREPDFTSVAPPTQPA